MSHHGSGREPRCRCHRRRRRTVISSSHQPFRVGLRRRLATTSATAEATTRNVEPWTKHPWLPQAENQWKNKKKGRGGGRGIVLFPSRFDSSCGRLPPTRPPNGRCVVSDTATDENGEGRGLHVSEGALACRLGQNGRDTRDECDSTLFEETSAERSRFFHLAPALSYLARAGRALLCRGVCKQGRLGLLPRTGTISYLHGVPVRASIICMYVCTIAYDKSLAGLGKDLKPLNTPQHPRLLFSFFL